MHHVKRLRRNHIAALGLCALLLALWGAARLPRPAFANSGGSVTYYTLTLCTPSNGDIIADPIGPSYVSGTTVTLTADSDPGYAFDYWTGALSGSVNPTTITMNAAKSVCAVFVADSTPPVITLLGDDPLYVECGGTYTDPGATASDNHNGDITDWIIVAGDTVDPDTPGEYEVTYDVTDEAENDATQVTRTVIVEDTTPPVITLTGPTEITLDYANWYVETGVSAIDTCGGDVSDRISNWTNLNVFTAGEFEYEYDVTDDAGNVATTASRTITVLAPVLQTLNYSVTGAGTLSFSPTPLSQGTGYVSYMGGTYVTITPTPNTPGDSLYVDWGGAGAGSIFYNADGTYSVLLNKPMTVTADLVASAKLTFTATPQGLTFGPDYLPVPTFDVTPLLQFPSLGPFDYQYVAIFDLDDVVSVTLPDTETVGQASAFDYWDCPGEAFHESTAQNFTITMDADKTVGIATQAWSRLRLLEDREDLGGGAFEIMGDATFTVAPATSQYPVEWDFGNGQWQYAFRPGAVVSLSPVPESGNVFSHWEYGEPYIFSNDPISPLDLPPQEMFASLAIPLDLTMDHAWQVQPVYTVGRTLTVTGPSGGSLSLLPPEPALVVADGDPTADELYGDGTLVRVRAAASPGYTFVSWGDALASQENAVFLSDDFTGTTLNPQWSVNKGDFGTDGLGHLQLTSATGTYTSISTPNDRPDGEFRFSYQRVESDTWLEVALRLLDGNNQTFIQFRNDYLWLRESIDGVKYYRSGAVGETTEVGTWYHVLARCKGATIEVYRAVETGPYELVASSSNIAIQTTNTFRFTSYADEEYLIDDVELRNLYSDAYVLMDADKTVSANFGAADDDPPVIKLVPPAAMTIECGEAYEEPGYSVEDEGYVEDLASRVIVTGAVDTGTPDAYTLAYNVTDGIVPGTGNAAATVYRTVTVEDTTPPVITLDGPNPMGIGLNDTFTEPGASAEDSCDTSVNSVNSDAGTALNTSAYGTYSITYSATDAANNTGTAERTVVVGYTLTIAQIASGAVDPAPGDHHYLPDTVVPVTALPIANFSHWEGDDIDQETDNAVQITMDADKAITAVFLGQAVTFGDSGLDRAIRIALGKGDEEEIYGYELESITYLDGSNLEIVSLAGIEQLTGLTELRLNDNNIADLSPLSGLTGLVSLELAGNVIANLSPLSGLTNLEHLNLESNAIGSVAAIANISTLYHLDLGRNSITSLGPLGALTNLLLLNIDHNEITSLTGLQNLLSLVELDLSNNAVTSIAPLQYLVNLNRLDLSSNRIESLYPLVVNTGFATDDFVDAVDNPIRPNSFDNDIPAIQANGATILADGLPFETFSQEQGCSQIIWGKQLDSFRESYQSVGHLYSVVPTSDGGLVLFGALNSHVFRLVKLDADGSEVWIRDFDGLYSAYGTPTLVPTQDGGFAFCGVFYEATIRPRIVKTDSSGIEQWRSSDVSFPFEPCSSFQGGLTIFGGAGFAQTVDGGFILASRGYKPEPCTFPPTTQYLFKFDSNGSYEWLRSIGGDYQHLQWFRPSNDGGSLAALPEPGIPANVFGPYRKRSILKIDNEGEVLWEVAPPSGFRFQIDALLNVTGYGTTKLFSAPNHDTGYAFALVSDDLNSPTIGQSTGIYEIGESGILGPVVAVPSGYDVPRFAPAFDGGYILVLREMEYNPPRYEIAKLDSAGDRVWKSSVVAMANQGLTHYDSPVFLGRLGDNEFVAAYEFGEEDYDASHRVIKFTDECTDPTTDVPEEETPETFEPGTEDPPAASDPSTNSHAEGESGEEHFAGPVPEPPNQGGDPVNLFSGEFVERMTDLQVQSPGIDFEWSRFYRSKQEGFRSDIGEMWDYSYNLWLKRSGNGEQLKIHDGRGGRDEIWTWNAQEEAWEHEDYPAQVSTVDVGGEGLPEDLYYELTYSDHTRYRYFPLHASFGGRRGRISSITDRNGNAMYFRYEDRPGGGSRLYRITDTAGRQYRVSYYGSGLIRKVTDFTGRSIFYGYTDDRNLDYVKDDAGQKINEYGYDSGRRMTTIKDGRGNLYLTTIYSSETEGFMKDRVVRQYYGDGIFDFSYEDLCPTGDCGNPNNPRWRTVVNDGEGNIRMTTFDSRNRTRTDRVYLTARDADEVTTFPMLASAGWTTPGVDFLDTTYQYDGLTSLVARVDHPEGDYQTFTYGGAEGSEDDWWLRGNLRSATSHNVQDAGSITQSWDYEPGHGNYGTSSRFVKRYTDGRGNETHFTYDGSGNILSKTIENGAQPDVVENYAYNRRGQVVVNTRPANIHGHRRIDQYLYNSSGYLTQTITDVGGEELPTVFVPSATGLVLSKTDANGNTTARGYDHRDRLIWERSPLLDLDTDRQIEREYFYDGNNNLIKTLTSNFNSEGVVDASNPEIERQMAYNTLNSLTDIYEEVIEGVFIHSQNLYDRNENIIEVRTPLASGASPPEPDNVVEYAYDTRQLLVEERRGAAYTVEYVRDLNGNILEEHLIPSDPEEDTRSTFNTYDGYNRLHTTINPMGTETEFGYDNNGNVTSIVVTGELEDTAAAGNIRISESTSQYDALNRRTHAVVKYFNRGDQTNFGTGESVSEWKFDPFGNVYEVINPNGHTTTWEFDTANRAVKSVDAKGNTSEFILDANGNPTTTTETRKSDLEGPDVIYTSLTAYDALNRPISVTNNANDTAYTGYDSRSNVTYSKDGEGNETRVAYDGLGRAVQTTNVVPGGIDVITAQTWDLNSRLKTRTDPNDNVTEYFYDAMNRLDYMEYADGTVTDYGYDSFGNEVYRADANGTEIETHFDLLNRPVARAITVAAPNGAINGTTAEIFKYDSLSNIIHAENNESTVTRVFDSMNNLRSETTTFKDDDFEKTISHTYDAMGKRDYTAYPGGRTVEPEYDELERLSTIHSSVGGDANGLLAEYHYIGPRHVERRTTWGNNTYLDYGYDAAGRVSRTTHTRLNPNATETIFDDRSYTWDGANNKTQRVEWAGVDAVKTYDYEYDTLNRMWRSSKSLVAVPAGTPGSWSGDMNLSSVSPNAVAHTGGETVTLSGNFDADYDAETLGVYVSKDQGTADIAEDYPATIVSASASEIEVKAPPRNEQGTFDIYASAMDGVVPIYSNPKSITYGPMVTTYDLDGAGNRNEVAQGAETAEYEMDDDTPAPADAQVHQYTQTATDVVARAYDGNGNPIRTGAALPASYRHDFRDRITQAVSVPDLGGGAVPIGSEFSDDFASGMDAAWVHDPPFTSGLTSAQWTHDSGAIEHTGTSSVANSAYPRTNPDGDFWWVYTRPSGASGDDVMTAYLRTLGSEDDIITPPSSLTALFLDIEVDQIVLESWPGGTVAASSAITTVDDTAYLIHAHVVGSTVVVRRGELGEPMETILSTDNAPLQESDRFVLTTANTCIVDDVNIGHFKVEFSYDALGRRIERRIDNGATIAKTRFIHDGARVAEEWDVPATGSPTLEASYVYGNYVDEVLTMRRGGVDYYHHGDDMHNVVKLTDGDGLVVEGYDYGDYGAPEFYDENGARTSATASAFGNPYLFSGREWEEELGLYHFRNRYMDPALGRFTSRDPIGIWGDPLNLGNGYTYCASNPWSYSDPFGLAAEGNQGGPAMKVTRGFSRWLWDVGLAILEADKLMKNPDYLAEKTVETTGELQDVAAAIKEDPIGVATAVGDAAKEKMENFGWEDAGYVAPDLVMSVKGGIKTIKSAIEMAGEAGDLARMAGKGVDGKSAWKKADGTINWPPNRGFEGVPEPIQISPGTRIDRFGGRDGTFVSPEGTPFPQRALPPGYETRTYAVYEVVGPIDASVGRIAPWFGQPGGGIQYELRGSIQDLLDAKLIRKVE